MKKKTKMMIILIILFAFTLIISIILTKNSNKSNHYQNERVLSEINFLDYQIIKLSQQFDEYFRIDSPKIDWNEIELQTNNLSVAWNSIIIDLSSFNIKNNHLTDFGLTLDQMMMNIQDKNSNKVLENMSKLYYFLKQYVEIAYTSNLEKNIINAKYYLLTAYSQLYTENWTLINENLDLAISNFYQCMNTAEVENINPFQLNKIYISMNELKNSLTYKDKEIFSLKYTTLMEQLNNTKK